MQQNLLKIAQEIEEHVRAVTQILRRPLETRIAREGLTGPQLGVLRTLFHSDRLTLSELSQKVGLAHSTISGIVDRLEARGIVERVPHESDGRFTRIAISKQVLAYVREKLPATTLHPMMKALSKARPDERDSVLIGLRTLRRLLQPAYRTGPLAATHQSTKR
jgi:DNA-binding MarR family transcriptional regulator